MEENEQVEIMSYDEARYMGVGKLDSTDIQLMNVGVSKMEESSNPTEKSIQYIGDKSKSNKVTGYDNQFNLEMDLIKNEKVIEDLHDIFYYRKTGVNAQRYVYIVDLWKPIENKTKVYRARKIKVSAVMSSKTPTPGETITLGGGLKGIGDFIYGEFNTSSKQFTEDSTSNANDEE